MPDKHLKEHKRLLRNKEVQDYIGISRTAIYNKLKEKSPYYDPKFPRPIQIGAKSIVWIEEEIEDYIQFCKTHTRSQNIIETKKTPKNIGDV